MLAFYRWDVLTAGKATQIYIPKSEPIDTLLALFVTDPVTGKIRLYFHKITTIFFIMLRPSSYANDVKPGMSMTCLIIFPISPVSFQDRKQEKVF